MSVPGIQVNVPGGSPQARFLAVPGIQVKVRFLVAVPRNESQGSSWQSPRDQTGSPTGIKAKVPGSLPGIKLGVSQGSKPRFLAVSQGSKSKFLVAVPRNESQVSWLELPVLWPLKYDCQASTSGVRAGGCLEAIAQWSD